MSKVTTYKELVEVIRAIVCDDFDIEGGAYNGALDGARCMISALHDVCRSEGRDTDKYYGANMRVICDALRRARAYHRRNYVD